MREEETKRCWRWSERTLALRKRRARDAQAAEEKLGRRGRGSGGRDEMRRGLWDETSNKGRECRWCQEKWWLLRRMRGAWRREWRGGHITTDDSVRE